MTTNDSRVRLVAHGTGAIVETFCGGSNDSLQVRASPDFDASRLVMGGDDARVCVWSRGSGGGGEVVCEAFSADEGAQDGGVAEALGGGPSASAANSTGRVKPATLTVALFAPMRSLLIARPAAAAGRWRADALDALDELADAVERAAHAAAAQVLPLPLPLQLQSARPPTQPPPATAAAAQTRQRRLSPSQLAAAAERVLRAVAVASAARAAAAGSSKDLEEDGASGDDASASDSASRGSMREGEPGGGLRRTNRALSPLEAALARAAEAFDGAASDAASDPNHLNPDDPLVRAAGEALALTIFSVGSAGPRSAVRAGAEWSGTRARARRLRLPLAARYGLCASVPAPRTALDGHCVIVTGDAAGVLRVYEVTSGSGSGSGPGSGSGGGDESRREAPIR